MNILRVNRKVLLFFLGAFLLCGWGFLIYSNSLHAPFQFDDWEYIIRNDTIKNLETRHILWEDKNYRKRCVVFFSFALNYFFSRDNPFGYHCTNLAIHLLMILTVWWFARIILSFDEVMKKERMLYGFFAALLFAAHPIQTQAITYISQRFTALASLAYLLSVCFYIYGRMAVKSSGFSIKCSLYFFISVFFGLTAMLSKESAFSLPLAFLMIELVLFEGKNFWKGCLFLAGFGLSALG